MATIIDILKATMPKDGSPVEPFEPFVPEPRCYAHDSSLPCPQCETDMERGYSVKVLAGRCANGSELGSGTRWHSVPVDSWKALCGAQPGRRSAGWSVWYIKGQEVTCPRCLKKLSRIVKE